MTTINITFDVLNSGQIVKQRKGLLASLFTTFFLSDEKVKEMVEQKMTEEMIKVLEKNLKEGFIKEGVQAKFKITVNGGSASTAS
jgi:hypothetical protein